MKARPKINPESLRQRVLSLLSEEGALSIYALEARLQASRKEVHNALSGLRKAGKVECLARGCWSVARRRGYERPPEGRIEVAGPVYARGYRWGAEPL